MKFLNDNATAIQALCAVLSLVVTAVLVYQTVRYDKLTNRLADSAESQMRYLTDESEQRRRRLLASIKLLRVELATLPETLADGERMRMATLWDSDELNALLSEAATVGMAPGHHAARLCVRLRRIGDWVSEVKSSSVNAGYDWSKFDWASFELETIAVRTDLKSLWESITESRVPEYDPNRRRQ